MEAYKSGPKRRFMEPEVRGWTGTEWVHGTPLTPFHLSLLAAAERLNSEIYIRAVDPVYDGGVSIHDCCFILDTAFCSLNRVEPESLGEITYCMDTNSTMIYEGDIVLAEGFHPEILGLVYRNREERGWPFMVHLKPTPALQAWPEWVCLNGFQWRVVGNWVQNRHSLLGDWQGTDSGRGGGSPLWVTDW